MIEAMPRPRPPNLIRETTRHGRIVWYVRIGEGRRTRIRGDYGSPEFMEQYRAAFSGEAAPDSTARKASRHSLQWLVEQYMGSGAWLALADDTRKQRGAILRKVVAVAGRESHTVITHKRIQAGIDRRSYSAAKHFRQTMRGLFQWAVAAQHADADPTEDAKLPRRPKTEGFIPWSDEWCAAYEKRWPLGTRQRVWYEVIYGTGLRRGDSVRVGRQHVKNRRGVIRAEKNDETAYFLVSDRLQAALDAGPTGDLTWIVGERGHPLKKTSFGNEFGKACRAAGVPSAAHGIRKTKATMEAEAGASGPRLDALFGWKTGSNTSAIYIRKADRAKLAFGPDKEQNGNSYPRTLPAGEGSGAKNP